MLGACRNFKLSPLKCWAHNTGNKASLWNSWRLWGKWSVKTCFDLWINPKKSIHIQYYPTNIEARCFLHFVWSCSFPLSGFKHPGHSDCLGDSQAFKRSGWGKFLYMTNERNSTRTGVSGYPSGIPIMPLTTFVIHKIHINYHLGGHFTVHQYGISFFGKGFWMNKSLFTMISNFQPKKIVSVT